MAGHLHKSDVRLLIAPQVARSSIRCRSTARPGTTKAHHTAHESKFSASEL